LRGQSLSYIGGGELAAQVGNGEGESGIIMTGDSSKGESRGMTHRDCAEDSFTQIQLICI
jgi:hypothetical protein